MRDTALMIIFFGLLPFVFSRPYVGIYLWTWFAFMNPHRLTYGFAFDFPFAQVIALATLISLLHSKQPKQIPWTRETVLLLIFVMWMLFTSFFAFYPELAWKQWDKVWKIMLMVYVTMMVINSKQKLDWLVWVIVLSLGLYGVKGGIFTVLHGGVHRVQGPIHSFISGNNEMGLALIMTIPLMRYVQLQAKSVWVHQSMTIAMLLTGIAAIGTQSRGALVGMVAMGVFLWLKSRSKIFILLSILLVVGAVATIMPQQWYERMATIQTYQEDASAMGRVNAWWTAFNLAKNRVTGGGFETWHDMVFRLYAPDPSNTRDVHSIYFEVMGEHGFIGFSLFMLLAWFTWSTGEQVRRQARGRVEIQWAADLASMIQVSMIGYAVAGAFLGLAYFDLYYTLIAIMVIGNMILKEKIFHMQVIDDAPVSGIASVIEYSDRKLQSLRRSC